jgi:hypothetical protein
MKVDYDPEARSILFEFGEFREYEEGDYTETLAGYSCIVWFHDDRPESIQLLGADKDITPLDEAAERFGLDADALRAGAQAALAAPNREIRIDIGRNLADVDREAEAAAPTPRSG